MKRSLALLLSCLHCIQGSHWAVIVAGSKEYWNYRHQADACHAYHVVKSKGIPKSNIITMMYDDIATSKHNPFPGQLFNHPSSLFTNPIDVYKDCAIDYRQDQVTPANFMQVLTGNASANIPKVLKSTKEDRVFVFFVDHGGPGAIAFPNGSLRAAEFKATLQTMYEKQLYKELVIYMEACESGSMFTYDIPSEWNIFITTAANAKESSFGTYCPPFDFVHGKFVHTCLGDLYSVNWMEDSEKSNLSQETVWQQYLNVRKKTKLSHVSDFGSEKMAKQEMVGDFLTEKGATKSDPPEKQEQEQEQRENVLDIRSVSAVDAHDIPLVTKFYMYLRATPGDRADISKELLKEIQLREWFDRVFLEMEKRFLQLDVSHEEKKDVDIECQDQLHEVVSSECGNITDYSRKYLRVLVEGCQRLDTATIIREVKQICRHGKRSSAFKGSIELTTFE